MEIIMLIKESAIEIITAIGTIVTLILTRGKTEKQHSLKNEKKIAKLKARGNKRVEKLKKDQAKIEELEKEI